MDFINFLEHSVLFEGLKDLQDFVFNGGFTTQPLIFILFCFLGGVYILCHYIKEVDDSKYRLFKYNKEIDEYIKSFKIKHKRIKKM